jgi:ubiquinone/menaquinone biosynthesis C-methylase UbiE
VIDSMLGAATETMLASTIRSGMDVVDVAAGAGGQTILAARRVGPSGSVLAIDIDAGPLEFAASVARELGLGNIEFRAIPCERLSEVGTTFDAVISRNGLQYLYDLPKGFAQIYGVLRRGGTMGAIVWSAPERNPFLSTSFDITYRKLGRLPPTHDEPSPFRLGYDQALQSALEDSGFRDVRVAAVSAPTRFESAAEATQFQQEAGGELLRLMGGLSDAARAEAWREISQALRAFESDNSFVADGELIVGTGTK